jgi:hypothetical protein
MTFDVSPATESTLTPRPSAGLSSLTSPLLAPPRTPDEAAQLLDAHERELRACSSGLRERPIRALLRFLGANSRAWPLEHRERLHNLLAAQGSSVVEPMLDALGRTPRTDVLDAAEAVLSRLPRGAAPRLGSEATNAYVVAPSVRAIFLRAAVRLDFAATAMVLLRSLLDPSSPEIRAAAAALVGERRSKQLRPLLTKLLLAEAHPEVREALEQALDESNGLDGLVLAILLRRTRYAVWSGPDRNLGSALGELARSDVDTDGLSVFEVSTDDDRRVVIAAMACIRGNCNRVDVIEIPREIAEKFGVVARTPEAGTTPVTAANALHCSLDWAPEQLRALATWLFENEVAAVKYPPSAVRAAVSALSAADVEGEMAKALVAAERK